jgi:hypothetical protein
MAYHTRAVELVDDERMARAGSGERPEKGWPDVACLGQKEGRKRCAEKRARLSDTVGGENGRNGPVPWRLAREVRPRLLQ